MGRASSRVAGPAALALALALALAAALAPWALAGCAARPVVTGESPACTGAAISAGSDLTEASQFVEVRLRFPCALESDGDVAADLSVMLNGSPPDPKTVSVAASVEGDCVVVRLSPTEAADGSDPRVYFALSEGRLSVSARDGSGGLAHVRAAGAGAVGPCAALPDELGFTVPTGIAFDVVEQAAGDAEANVPARTRIRMTQFAQVRCCSWFSFGADFPTMMKHNHNWLRDTPATCAANLADMVNHMDESGALGLTAQAQGAYVELVADKAVSGQLIEPALAEGPGVDPMAGAYEAEPM